MMMKISLMNLSALLVVALTATTCMDTTHAFAVTPATSKTTSKSMAEQQRMRGPTSSTQLPMSFLTELFSPKTKKVKAPPAPVFDPVVIEPDFRVAALFLVSGVALDFIPYLQLTLGPVLTLLGILFLVQTFRIRFVFDELGAFELKTGKDAQGDSGENKIVGGANRWDTETIINYDFFPKGWIDGPVGPILVYFKETQTPSESWNEGPGKMANDPDKIASGAAAPGQVHFFPAVCNAQQIRDEFAKRNCRKI
jgi:hypothetical protein